MTKKNHILFSIFGWMNKHMWIYIVMGYILINFLFMHSFWHELIFDQSKVGARYGEVFAWEWALNEVYHNVISGHNPFQPTLSILYPFGTDYLGTDSGNGIIFVLLRPFLSPHQSLSIIVAFGLFMASIGMYFLLRKLQIQKMTAFIIGAMYGYMTFLMPRFGHLNYMAIYVFPWFYFSLISMIASKKQKQKTFYSFLTALLFVMTLYTNAYYFVMLIISLIVLNAYFIFSRKKQILRDIFIHKLSLFITIICIVIFAWPWLKQTHDTKFFEGLPKTEGWGGAIQFSSDLFGFFILSTYSYFLHSIGGFWGTHFKFARSIFEEFSYPGITILTGYIFLAYLFWKKKLPSKLHKKIASFFIVSIVFWLLTLGPFLHVFGHWGFTVDEGIRIVIPLPFIIMHYVPLLANIRVPGRFTVGFIFFAYIVTAYLIDYFLSLKSKLFRKYFYAGLFILFIIDHYFFITTPATRFIPNKAYSYLREQKDESTVLQIPSVVRDGFTYFGSTDDIEFIEGQTIHGKPMVGGYMGRVPSHKRNYYIRNPFLGYIWRMIDPSIEQNGGIDKTDLSTWYRIDKKKSIDTIDFLDLKYVLLDQSKEYSASISAILSDFGYAEKLKDHTMSVLVREPSRREFLSVDVGSPDDDIYLGIGWHDREQGYRWAGKKSSIMLKIKIVRNFNLLFETKGFHASQKVKVYINRKKINEITIPTERKLFNIPINKNFLIEGINTIDFISDSSYRPSDVMIENLDRRELSYRFYSIILKNNLL